MAKSYLGLEEAADVLQFCHWMFYREGRGVTAYGLARGHDYSVYRARRILEQLEKEGMMRKTVIQHRSNSDKKVYTVTEQGESYYQIFDFRPPTRLKLDFENEGRDVLGV